ncbi:MAG: hypothetical protein SOX50_03750 [Terrisporobacter othiniensis]|uniref:hypothetical protein n=1 Tax=Terrisporobacter othiniensis TaxID=1577792 RepID=UPI002A753CA4|nr:hypothetical protein [Terrisporobacter othiniensis]MDY3372367.1 hypothetical protein [Terrisporobacter othiniensis]
MKTEFIKINFKDAIEGVNFFKKVGKDVDEMDLNATKLAKEEFNIRLAKDEVYAGLIKEREYLSENLETYRKALSCIVCSDSNDEKENNIKKHIELIKEELNEIDKKLDYRRKEFQELCDVFIDKRIKDKEVKTKVFINAAIGIGAGAAMLHPKTRKIVIDSGKSILKMPLK